MTDMSTTKLRIPFPYEPSRKLAGMIIQEMEAMTFTKESYDLEFPDHAKDLPRVEMWGIARSKVIEELCTPDPCLEENSPDSIRQ
jgi:hypothetical protein